MRTVAVAVAFAALIASPAFAGVDTVSVRVSLVGKTAEQIQADVMRAAQMACREANRGGSYSAMRLCAVQARNEAMKQVAAGRTQLASL